MEREKRERDNFKWMKYINLNQIGLGQEETSKVYLQSISVISSH